MRVSLPTVVVKLLLATHIVVRSDQTPCDGTVVAEATTRSSVATRAEPEVASGYTRTYELVGPEVVVLTHKFSPSDHTAECSVEDAPSSMNVMSSSLRRFPSAVSNASALRSLAIHIVSPSDHSPPRLTPSGSGMSHLDRRLGGWLAKL